MKIIKRPNLLHFECFNSNAYSWTPFKNQSLQCLHFRFKNNMREEGERKRHHYSIRLYLKYWIELNWILFRTTTWTCTDKRQISHYAAIKYSELCTVYALKVSKYLHIVCIQYYKIIWHKSVNYVDVKKNYVWHVHFSYTIHFDWHFLTRILVSLKIIMHIVYSYGIMLQMEWNYHNKLLYI